MAGVKISDLNKSTIVGGDIVPIQRGTGNFGGTIGNQLTAFEASKAVS